MKVSVTMRAELYLTLEVEASGVVQARSMAENIVLGKASRPGELLALDPDAEVWLPVDGAYKAEWEETRVGRRVRVEHWFDTDDEEETAL